MGSVGKVRCIQIAVQIGIFQSHCLSVKYIHDSFWPSFYQADEVRWVANIYESAKKVIHESWFELT